MPKPKWLPQARYGILAAACFILVLQAGATRMLKVEERNMPIPGLHTLPWELGTWKASGEQLMPPSTEAYLKPDEYILRDYVDQQKSAAVNVFVAYFKSLQNSYGPHSPSVCLPGSGWLVSSSKVVNMPVPGRPDGIPVNEYTMEKLNDRLLVLYWYQNDRDIWAREFQAKLRLLPDLVRYHRSDVSLVRLIAPIRNPSPEDEFNNCLHFTQRLYPLLVERFASIH